MYFLLLAFTYIVVYICGIVWFQVFAHKRIILQSSFSHIAVILGVFFGVLLLVAMIRDFEMANRVQHAFGGGFMISLIAYFSYRASQVELSSFVLFHIFFLLATAF
jgi:hypothetical protein